MADRRHKKFKTEFIAKERIECFKNTILNNNFRRPSVSENINDATIVNKVNFKKVIYELQDILSSSQKNKEEINRSRDISNISKNSSMISLFNSEKKTKSKTSNHLPLIDLNQISNKSKKLKQNESTYQYSSFYRQEKNKNIQYENNISQYKFNKLIKEDIINVKSNRLKSLHNSKVNITEEFNLKEEIFLMKNGVDKPGNILKTGKSVSTINPRYIKTKIINKKLLFNKIMQESMNIYMYK